MLVVVLKNKHNQLGGLLLSTPLTVVHYDSIYKLEQLPPESTFSRFFFFFSDTDVDAIHLST